MNDAEYEAMNAADSIISLLYYRERREIEALDPHYVTLLDEALRKLAPFTRVHRPRKEQ